MKPLRKRLSNAEIKVINSKLAYPEAIVFVRDVQRNLNIFQLEMQQWLDVLLKTA